MNGRVNFASLYTPDRCDRSGEQKKGPRNQIRENKLKERQEEA